MVGITTTHRVYDNAFINFFNSRASPNSNQFGFQKSCNHFVIFL